MEKIRTFFADEMSKTTIHVCPNGCDAPWETAVVVMQYWAVDAEGNFLANGEGGDSIVKGPQLGKSWVCSGCGRDVEPTYCKSFIVDELERMKVYIPDGGELPVRHIFISEPIGNMPKKVLLDGDGCGKYKQYKLTLKSDGSMAVSYAVQEFAQESYTAYRFGETDDEILDATKFDDARDAIRYAVRNQYHKVVNDKDGEVIYTKPRTEPRFTLSIIDQTGEAIEISYANTKEEALMAGIKKVASADELSLHIRENNARPAKAPAHFISWKKINKLMDENNGDIEAVVSILS